MYHHPYISSQIVQERHGEMLASAEQERRARHALARSHQGPRPGAQPDPSGQPLLRALRTAARLRLAARAAARRPEFARELAGPAAGLPGPGQGLTAPDTAAELVSR